MTPDAALLADYHSLFDEFVPAAGLVNPAQQTPAPLQIDDSTRNWGNWHPNTPPSNLIGPIIGIADGLYCEVVFLGETGTGWGRFGFTNNGTDHLLGASAADRPFGAYALPLPTHLDRLDFFVELADPNGGTLRYNAFESGANSPAASPADCYWGVLAPFLFTPGSEAAAAGASGIPFTVFAFVSPFTPDDQTPDLFVFAARAGYDRPAAPVPEPGTFGLTGALCLAVVLGLKRARATAR